MTKSEWVFENELRFITTLGNYSNMVASRLCTRADLLNGYRLGLTLRNDGLWTAAQLKMLNDWIAIELRRELAPKAA